MYEYSYESYDAFDGFVMISMSMASMRRIAEVLDEKTDIHNPEHPVYEVTDGSITFKNVDFSYKKDSAEKVLKDINRRFVPEKRLELSEEPEVQNKSSQSDQSSV